MKLYLIIGAIILAALGWHSYVAKQLKETRAELTQAHATIKAKDKLLETERADRRHADETVTVLQARLKDRDAEPPIVGVRCRSTARLPTEGRAAGGADATTAHTVEGLPARDPRGEGSQGPEVDVSAGLDWYASQCGAAVATFSTLQGWERGRTH